MEHGTAADKKPTDFTSSRAVTQAGSDQPSTADIYSRPSVDSRHAVRENGNVDAVQQQVPSSFHTETHESRYADACS